MSPSPSSSQRSLDYHISLESMEGLIAPSAQPQTSRAGIANMHAILHAVYPGLLVAGTIAVAATWLSQAYHAPVMLFALLLGMAFHFLHEEGPCRAGIEFASRSILRLGVALLGMRLSYGQVSSLGLLPVITVMAAVTSTLIFGVIIGRWCGLGRMFGLLSGGAVGICGASAALAISTTMPVYAMKERDTVLTVVIVTTLSTIAMVLYPLLVTALHLDHVQAGVFLGGTIHDVAQVVGAGYMISPQTGDISTYVKLMRVAMLIPVTLSLVFWFRARGDARSHSTVTFPLFLLGFIALVALNSLVDVPPFIVTADLNVSNWCLVTAIAALGMKTSLRDLYAVGWKPVALMVAETLWIAAVVLSVVLISSAG
jgi:uncharacterized integral membrane protein (TIGR00698 family)